MPFIAPILAWLAEVAIPAVLGFLARNAFHIFTIGWIWLSTRTDFSKWFGEKFSGMAGFPDAGHQLSVNALHPSTVSNAYSLMDQFFPLHETFALFIGWMGFYIACIVFRRGYAILKTASHGVK